MDSELEWLDPRMADSATRMLDTLLRLAMQENGEDPDDAELFKIRRSQLGWSLHSRLDPR